MDLREAYLSVYNLDEGYSGDPTTKINNQTYRARFKAYSDVESGKKPNAAFEVGGRLRKMYNTIKHHDPEKVQAIERANRERGEAKRRSAALNREQVDLYDIILSHLIDEGYANTTKAAEVIMVNMSEEWIEDIIEEVLDEERRSLDIEKNKSKGRSTKK